MTLISFSFFCLFAFSLLLYYGIPKRLQNGFLILVSLVFCYFADGPRTILFLGFSTLTTYAGARRLEQRETPRQRTVLFLAVLLANIGILVSMKYLNFFVWVANAGSRLFATGHSFDTFQILAPLGISFYTLQVIGYLADVYMGKIPAEKSILKYAAFAMFFPQLTSGPINRYADMEPEFSRERPFSYSNITFGVQRMLWGLFKKLVISERAAILVNTIFNDFYTYSGFYIVFASMCFAVQLYTDFSGYMDIALGTAQAYGIRLAENFDRPFFARSISEYWRRWHITLGTWFKDYVFYPMLKSEPFIRLGKWGRKKFGRKRGKKLPTRLALVILWFSVGFWHGGLWKYIFGSGLLHCFYIISGELLEDVFGRIKKVFHIRTECFSYHLFQSVRTFLLVCYGFVFFRAGSFLDGVRMTREMLHLNINAFTPASYLGLGLDAPDLLVLVVGILILLLVSILQERGSVRNMLAEQNLAFRWGVYYLLFFAVVIFGLYGPGYIANQFIYQNF